MLFFNNLFKNNSFLETSRLLLRPWKFSDTDDFFIFAQDLDVSLKSGWKPHKNPNYSSNIIQYCYMNNHTFAIELKETNSLIGSINLDPFRISTIATNKKESELGYWIGKPYWNHGYATEAAKRMIQYGFEKFKLNTIKSGTLYDNYSSKRVLEKIGFKYIYTLDNTYSESLQKNITEDIYLLEKVRYEKEIRNRS